MKTLRPALLLVPLLLHCGKDEKRESTNSAPSSAASAFDRSEAASALEAVNLSRCHDDAGAIEGHVTVIFDPSGKVRSAVVDEGPLVGTEAGACVARAIESAKIRPFGGVPVRIGKRFRL